MSSNSRHRRAMVFGASAMALSLGSAPVLAQSTLPRVDIPAQPLGLQLQELGRETNTDILFTPADVANLQGPAIHGAMSPRQAVERLIAATRLEVMAGPGGALILKSPAHVSPSAATFRQDPPAPPAPAPAQTAPAQTAPSQTAAPQSSPAAALDAATTVDEVVVVGNVNPQGQRKLATGYAITTVSEQQLHEAAPISAADLLKLVPGVFVETTGGVSGPNIEVRGFPTSSDAPFATFEIDSLPIFPTPSLSFLDNSTQIRIDDTIKRTEATIGGPAVLLANGQPGATINFVQKNGKDDPGGSLRFTTGTGSLFRVDGYYGAQISDGWYASVGGFYRTDQGVRDTQYPADQGYQFVGTLTHDLEDGRLQLYGRVTHDQNAFYTDVPLIVSGSGKVSGFPGFDPLTGTFYGNATRYVTFDTAPGLNGAAPVSQTVDLSKGRGIDSHLIGFDFDKTVDGFTLSNKLSYIDEHALTLALFSGDNPESLGQFISDEVTAANATPAAVAAAGRPATTGSARAVATGAPLTNLSQQVIQMGAWEADKRVNAFQDEGRISHDLFEGNTLTGGFYFTQYHSHDVWYLGHNLLLTVQSNPTPVEVTLDNGVEATSPGGLVSPTSFALDNSYDGTNAAGFISDAWKVTDRLRVEAGVRLEHESVNATLGGNTTANLSSNPLAIYDNGASVLTGTSTPLSYGDTATSFSVDANYRILSHLNGFVGFNHGYALPTFDDLRSGVRQTTYVDQWQGGIKSFSSWYAVNLTGFYNKFLGQPTSQLLEGGQNVVFLTDSEAYGLEFDGDVRPFKRTSIDILRPFDLAVSGDYQHGRYTTGGPGIQGNEIARQPDVQARITPSYVIATPVGPLNLFGTVTFVDDRFADLQNTQPLPSYTTLDVGATLDLPHHVQLLFTGTNVTNTLGLTEGNYRVLGAGVSSNGVFLGRPLFGADYQFSAVIRF